MRIFRTMTVGVSATALATIAIVVAFSGNAAAAANILSGSYIISYNEICGGSLENTYGLAVTKTSPATGTSPFLETQAPYASSNGGNVTSTAGLLALTNTTTKSGAVTLTGFQEKTSLLSLFDNLGSSGVTSTYTSKMGNTSSDTAASFPANSTWSLACIASNCTTGTLTMAGSAFHFFGILPTSAGLINQFMISGEFTDGSGQHCSAQATAIHQ